MNKKGFTLIELLAVIVILAVIALITAPIVMGIITNTRESSNKVSANNYINEVNDTIQQLQIDNVLVENGYYEISEDGNVCIDEITDKRCVGKEINVNTKGNKPIKGNMIIEDQRIIRATIVFETFTVELGYDGELEYKPFSLKYNIGEEILVDMGANFGVFKFNVIGESANKVTLLFGSSVGTNAWTTASDHSSYIKSSETCEINKCMFVGPISMFKAMNAVSVGLDDLIIEDYEYINNNQANNNREYQKLTIKNGITTITDYQGNNNVVPGNTVARLLEAEEYLEIASMYNQKFSYENLRNLVIENLDFFSTVFPTKFDTIDELLEYLEFEDDWRSIYILSFIVINNYINTKDDIEALKYNVPEWLANEGEIYWTSSTIALQNTYTHIYVVGDIDLSSGNRLLILEEESSATVKNDIRPVIEINKNSERIQ